MSKFNVKLLVDGAPNADLAMAFQGRLTEVLAADHDRLALAYQASAKQVADRYKKELRADIVAGGFYRAAALSKTWRVNVFPLKPHLEPAIFIKSNADVILDAFSYGAQIQARGGKYLAIPTGPAKAIVRRMNQARNRSRNAFGKFMTEESPVARVAATLGVHLVPRIDSASGRGVLIADTATGGLSLTRGGREAKRQSKPTALFVLVKAASLKKRIKGLGLLEDLKGRFASDFAAAVARNLQAGKT